MLALVMLAALAFGATAFAGSGLVASFATGGSARPVSVSFNGRSSVVTIRRSKGLELSRAMTLEARVRPSSRLLGRRDIVVKTRRGGEFPWGVELRDGVPDVYATIGGHSLVVSGSSALALREWLFVVATYDGRRLRLYVDGRLLASRSARGRLSRSRGPVQVGGDSILGRHFRGLIDDVRVYDRAVPIAEPNVASTATPVRPPGTPTLGSADANLWVSPSGGTCTRQASRGSEIPSEDCASLNAAYAAAQCGDIVNIDAGNYSATVQDIQDPRGYTGGSPQDGCSSDPIVFEATPTAARSAVVFGTVEAGDGGEANTNGASNWTLQDVTVMRSINAYPPAQNITIDAVQGGGFYIDGVDGIKVENSTLGPCYSGTIETGDCDNNIKIDTAWRQASGQTYTTTNVTFIHNTIHDFENNGNTHFECMFLVGGTNIDIDSNRFIGCQNYAILIQNFRDTPFSNLIIQNNWFAETRDDVGSTQYAVDFGGTGQENNILVRYNSFAPDEGVTDDGAIPAGTNDWVIGNIGGNDYYTNRSLGCVPGLNYGYNLWSEVACGTGDSVQRTLPYVSTAAGAENFHLTPNSVAHDLVTPNTSDYQLDYDMDGNPRPPNGPRDAGSEQQTS